MGFTEKEQSRAKKKSVVGVIAGIETSEEQEAINKNEKPADKPKKKGRPKLENREKRARYSFTILPSVYEKAQDKAMQEGKTLSELVAEFLDNYAN